jgi:hypothetical protein
MSQKATNLFLLLSLLLSLRDVIAEDRPSNPISLSDLAVITKESDHSFVYLSPEVKTSIIDLKKSLPKYKWTQTFKSLCQHIEEEGVAARYESMAQVIEECLGALATQKKDGLHSIRASLEEYKKALKSGDVLISILEDNPSKVTRSRKDETLCTLRICDCLKVKGDLAVCGKSCIRNLKVGDLAVGNQLSVNGVDLATLVRLANILGALSPQGIQGIAAVLRVFSAAGPQGTQAIINVLRAFGAAGSQGSQSLIDLLRTLGAVGPQGAQGIAGALGAIGAAGPQGAQGIAGVLGAIGAAGSQGAQGIAGVLGAIGAAGPQGAAGIAGALGAIGAAGQAGPAGPAGVAGAIGAVGVAGATGAVGSAGAPGIPGIGGILGYAYIYSTSGQTVAIEADIPFDTNGLLTADVTHAPGTSQIRIISAGVYVVTFSVSGVEPGQFALFQNGALVAGSVYGSGAGTQQNSGQVIVNAGAGDVLTVRNHSSAAAVTLQTLAGGTQANVNASILLERVT